MITLTTKWQLIASSENIVPSLAPQSLEVHVYARYTSQDLKKNQSNVEYKAVATYDSYIIDQQGSWSLSGTGANSISGTWSRVDKSLELGIISGTVAHEANGDCIVQCSATLNAPMSDPSGTASGTASGSANLPHMGSVKEINPGKTSQFISDLNENFESIGSAIESLQTIVDDPDSGLIQDIRSLETTVGDSNSGLIKDMNALKTTVGDSNSGLVKDVNTLKTTVGDSNSGLVKDVNSLKTKTQSIGKITYGTADPSGGSNGDIYLKYT